MKTSSELSKQLEFDFIKIPYGEYCYSRDENNKKIKCPFWKIREFNGVEIPWCEYLSQGGLPNEIDQYKGWEDDDVAIQKLREHFGDEFHCKTSALILFDWVKECGENTCIDENNPF